MKKFFTLIAFVLNAALFSAVLAQCPASVTASATTTAASCPSSGSVTISTTPAATASFLYMLTTGPAGSLLNVAQSSNTFNALLPGNYTARASCGAVTADVSFTISNGYAPITNVQASAAATCSGFTAGGTVNISVTGGSAPLSYSIIKSNDPNYPDASSVYTGSATKTVTSYGTYQVRVKDACNQFYTVTTTVAASLQPLRIYFFPFNSASCNPAIRNFYYGIAYTSTDGFYDPTAYNASGGVKINIYEKDPGNCAATGPLLYSFISLGNWLDDTVRIPVVASKKYFYQLITPCGDTTTDCFDLSEAENAVFGLLPTVQGCGTAGNPYTVTLWTDIWGAGTVFPITVKLYAGTDASGTLLATKTANSVNDLYHNVITFPGLTPGNYYMVATDACGHTDTQLINNPVTNPAVIDFGWFATNQCGWAGLSTVSGTSTVTFKLNGFIASFADNSIVSIISGPGSIGQNAVISGNALIWANLLPGNYVASITTACGTTNLPFTVPVSTDDMLTQNVTAVAASSCGAGSGSITASTDYNGGYSIDYVLVNATSNIAVDSNSNGVFLAVVPGSYFVKLKLSIQGGCTNSPSTYYVNSNTVTVTSSAGGPQINKAIGVTCEDVSGNSLSTGTAYISMTGSAPLLVEYKLTSSSTWLVHSSNAPAETAIGGLSAGGIYDIRVTGCGITNATQVTIGKAGHVHTITTQQPCVGNPYELALPQYSGASYEWKNALGTIISTAYNFTIPVYNNSFDGKYTAAVSWGSCAKRTDTVVLNSSLCGTFLILTVQLTVFTARTQNCAVMLSWKTAAAADITEFIIERSVNGKNYSRIGNVMQHASGDYLFTDNSQQQGSAYYRLVMKAADGHNEYSNTLVANSRCNSAGTKWTVYPSLVVPGSAVVIKLNAGATINTEVKLVVTSITGQQLNSYNLATHAGENNYTLPDSRLAPGTYLLCIYDNKGQQMGSVQKLVYTR